MRGPPHVDAETERASPSFGRGLVLGAWLVAADAWIKSVTRLGACEDTGRWPSPWSTPQVCAPIDFVGPVQIEPHGSDAILGIALSDAGARLAVIAALAIGLVALAWWAGRRWAAWGSAATGLGCGLAAVAILAAPITLGDGRAWTELVVAGVRFGLGELALVHAIVWMLWARVRG